MVLIDDSKKLLVNDLEGYHQIVLWILFVTLVYRITQSMTSHSLQFSAVHSKFSTRHKAWLCNFNQDSGTVCVYCHNYLRSVRYSAANKRVQSENVRDKFTRFRFSAVIELSANRDFFFHGINSIQSDTLLIPLWLIIFFVNKNIDFLKFMLSLSYIIISSHGVWR